MMRLSGSQAFGAGFRLIAEKPLVLLTWIGVYFLVGVAPQAVLFAWMAADVSALAIRDAAQMPMEAMLRFQMIAGLLQVVQIVGGLASTAILSCAIMRAMLEPQNSARAYLRLGAREGLVAAVIAVSFVLLFFATALAGMVIVIGGLIATLAGVRGGGAVQGAIVVVVGFGGVVAAALWISARFLPALPMTFAQRGFRLFEAWPLTRGHDWKLVGLGCALVATALILEIATVAVLAIPGGLFAVSHAEQIRAWMSGGVAPDLGVLAPVILVAVLAFTVLGALVHVATFAPWVDVYRQLTASEPDASL